MTRDEFEIEVDKRVADALGQWELPSVVYHYTSDAGFRGIVAERKLWATHRNFLNDHGEQDYAFDLLKEVAATHPCGSARTAAADMAKQDVLTRFGAFVACFSKHPDSLSQWRAYAQDGRGFSVGIDPRNVPKAEDLGIKAALSLGPYLCPVVYHKDRQVEALRKLLDLATLSWPSPAGAESADKQRRYLFDKCNTLMTLLAMSFKHDAFLEEGETRLVWIGPSPADVEATSMSSGLPLAFRMTLHGFAPYLTWPLAPEGSKAIHDVVTGPKHGQASADWCGAFLKWHGHKDSPLRRSSATYR